MKNSKNETPKPPKMGKSAIVFAGIFVLILLVFIAGWLTVRMLDLSEGLNQIAGTGSPGTAASDAPPQPASPLITKKVPPPSPPAPAPLPVNAETAAAPAEAMLPEAPPVRDQQPVDGPQETKEEKPEEPVNATDTEPTDSKPDEIQTAQSLGRIPSPGGAGLKDATPSTEPLPEKAERFSIQVGAFRVKQFANERASILKALGYDPYIFSATGAKGRTWHTVRIGKYETLEKAEAALSSFSRKSDFPTAIVHVNSLRPASTM